MQEWVFFPQMTHRKKSLIDRVAMFESDTLCGILLISGVQISSNIICFCIYEFLFLPFYSDPHPNLMSSSSTYSPDIQYTLVETEEYFYNAAERAVKSPYW